MRMMVRAFASCALYGAVVLGSAQAQQPAAMHRIGFLGPGVSSSPLVEEFRTALAHLGLLEGRDVVIETRWPEQGRLDRLPEAAKQLVDSNSRVILAIGATAARAAAAATTDIPIVFEIVIDPVAAGLVSHVERPAGNLTGFTTFDPDQARQQIAILKELLPGAKRVAVLGDDGAASTLFRANQDAARALSLDSIVIKVARGPSPDFDQAFQSAQTSGVDAVVVISTPVTTPNRKHIAAAAAKYRLPTLSPIDHADAGGVISYGTTFSESTRRAAGYVAKILNGATPADLPVETVKRQELVINATTARELGITLPAALRAKASRVIE